jgi:hypothetical protein
MLPCEARHVRDGHAGIAEAVSGKYTLVILDRAPPAADDLDDGASILATRQTAQRRRAQHIKRQAPCFSTPCLEMT